jgi:large subunit ribosomal protein L4
MTKNRALVSGSGKKPYKQKGTGRPRGRIDAHAALAARRHGLRPQPRSYDFALPKKGRAARWRGAAGEAARGRGEVVDELRLDEKKTSRGRDAQASRRLRQGLVIDVDVRPDEQLSASARNIAGVRMMPSGRCTARDIADSSWVLATRAAVERLQEVLG